MRQKRSLPFCAGLLIFAVVGISHGQERLTYPESRRSDHADVLHGVKVADPYRWLEDTNSAETKEWIKAQAEFTDGYLKKLPRRAAILKRLEEIWDYDKHGIPYEIGDRIFYSRKTGLQNQSVLYWRESAEGSPENILLDPNTLSDDGTVALSGYDISKDGKWMAYGISKAGSDWQEWKVRAVDGSKDTDDHLRWIKFSSASWSPDGKHLVYSRYDAPKEGSELKGENFNQKLYLHALGTDQSEDKLLYARLDEKEWGFGGGFTEDDRYLTISVWKGSASNNAVFYRDLEKGIDSETIELLPAFDARYDFVGNSGSTFYFRTDLDAPRGRLIAIDLAKPQREHWRTILPPGKDTLDDVSLIGGKFIATYMVDAHDEVVVYDLEGNRTGAVDVPNLGSVSGFYGKAEAKHTYYSVSGYTSPGTIYRYDIASGASTVFTEPDLPFDTSAFETRQVFYASKDGTQIPLFITAKKGLALDGKNPTILYGYGGFNIALTPRFRTSTIAWMEMGGVYAVANLRGGSEYGEDWHQAGMLQKKQNVFDDFIAAAEFLIAEKYTSTPKLAIQGGSNGGLLVGACLNQRPDLFGAGLSAVGVHDMLRYQKFTIGWAWQSEYGYPDKKIDFTNLLGYSPYHNAKPGTEYPPTLVLTADHDDRVFPAHSFKYGAAMQHAQAGAAPVLLRIEQDAGHGAGKPTAKVLEEGADVFAFLVEALGM